jgi:uncharacterized protein (DUF58 family)
VTVAALKLVLLIAAAMVLAQFVDWPYLDEITIALIGLLLVCYLWSRFSLRGLAVRRETATDRVQVGQTLRERLELRNRGLVAKLWIEVRDYSSLPGHAASRVVHVRGRDTVVWTADTVCTRRGRFRIGPLVIQSGDPFGLFPTSMRVPGAYDVIVYPATFDLSGYPMPHGQLTSGAAMTRRTPYVTPSVSGLREYAPGDAFGRISWTASARIGRWMVKEFDLDPSADVWIVLDLDSRHHRAITGAPARQPIAPWLTSTEEYGVSIAASLARRCLGERLNVGLIASSSRPTVVVPDRSERQEYRILEHLATARADGTRPLAETLIAEERRFRNRSTVIVITPSTDEAWVAALAQAAGRRARSAAIVVEAATFGAADPPMLVIGALAATGIPAHLIKFGDDIPSALVAPRGIAPSRVSGVMHRG